MTHPPDPVQRFEQAPQWARDSLCRRIGLTPTQIVRFLDGRCTPAGWMAREIAQVLDVPVEQLLRRDDDE